MVSTDAAPQLLEPSALAELGPPEAVRLPLDLVDPSPRNPRVGELPEIEALADNLQTFGLLQPVTVRRTGDRYELVGGHRRRAAFLLLRERFPYAPEWRTIPAVIRDADDDRAYLLLISAQVHSARWKPREEAAALERLYEALGSVEKVGDAVQRSVGWASKRLRVYADSVLSGYVQTGRLPASVAEELLVVRDPHRRQQMADQAVEEGWSQPEARTWVRELASNRQASHVGRLARDLLAALEPLGPDDLSQGAVRDLTRLLEAIRVVAQRPARGQVRRIVIPSIQRAMEEAGVSANPRPKKQAVSRKRC